MRAFAVLRWDVKLYRNDYRMLHMKNLRTPELLLPAGNPEKLKVAVKYGADAVYLGGQRYGLRAMSENFSEAELGRAVEFARKHGVLVYVTLNAFLHDADFIGLAEHAKLLENMGVSAAIVSDLGVASHIQENSNLAIHLSTQASCLNTHAAKYWKALGVRRVIVGRELTIAESGAIAKAADIEVEMFVHGAMCMAYSGNCTISNFTAGRDSNRGGCIQSCRFKYSHEAVDSFAKKSLQLAPVHRSSGNREGSGYFMSSRDQMGVRLIPEFIKHGICSLKIEGRMKSVFYAATLCAAYRRVIDACLEGKATESIFREAEAAVASVPHRAYFSGSMEERAGVDGVYEHDGSSATKGSHQYLGLVVDANKDSIAVKLARKLARGQSFEFIDKERGLIECRATDLADLQGFSLNEARQESIVVLPRTKSLAAVTPFTVARVRAG